jgi:CheY-like chemotaxis protein
MVMPEVDGAETITELRKGNPDVRIIAISGAGKPRLRMAKKLGALRTLPKPFGKSELLGTVQEVLVG